VEFFAPTGNQCFEAGPDLGPVLSFYQKIIFTGEIFPGTQFDTKFFNKPFECADFLMNSSSVADPDDF
jgi:hypothetical protein